MELDIIQNETLNQSKHTKNKSFDDNELCNECKSPFIKEKAKAWSSANNLNEESNTLTRRSVKKTDDKDISITINSENSFKSVDSLSSSADESVDEKINNRDVFSAKRYLVNLVFFTIQYLQAFLLLYLIVSLKSQDYYLLTIYCLYICHQ